MEMEFGAGVGAELRALRIGAGYGLYDVVRCVGIRAVTLAQIECGEIGSGKWEAILRDLYGS